MKKGKALILFIHLLMSLSLVSQAAEDCSPSLFKSVLSLMRENPWITRTELVEETGVSASTISRIISELKKAGKVEREGGPRFGYYRVEGGKAPSNREEERKEAVMILMRENPQITRAELVEKTEVSIRIIGNIISELKKEGRVEREGGPRFGYYRVEGGKAPSNREEERKEAVMILMRENPQITRAELSEETGVSIGTIGNIISELKKAGKVEREDGTRFGYYRVEGGKAPSNREEERKEAVMILMRKNPRITRAELSEETGVSTDIISGIISELRKEGRVIRIGGTAKGYYHALEEGEDAFSYRKKRRNQKKEEVMTLMRENPRIKVKELSEETGVSTDIISGIISELRKEGRVIRIGGTAKGYYHALEEGEDAFSYRKKRRNQKKEEVMTLMRENPRIKVKELSEETGVSTDIINGIISELKKEGKVERVSGSYGYYHVLEEGEASSNWKEQRKEEVLTLMREDPRIKIKELSEETGVSASIISRIISELKKEGKVERVGGPLGYYHVLEEGEASSNWKEQRKGEVLTLMRENPRIKIKELVEETGVSASTISRIISELKKEGEVERVGGPPGYYRFLK